MAKKMKRKKVKLTKYQLEVRARNLAERNANLIVAGTRGGTPLNMCALNNLAENLNRRVQEIDDLREEIGELVADAESVTAKHILNSLYSELTAFNKSLVDLRNRMIITSNLELYRNAIKAEENET